MFSLALIYALSKNSKSNLSLYELRFEKKIKNCYLDQTCHFQQLLRY